MPPLNPQNPYPCVFLFPIHKAINAGRCDYDATRNCWGVSQQYRQGGSIALGIVAGSSRASYIIDVWNQAPDNDRKYIFEGHQDGNVTADFQGYDCRNVIERALGFWQHGNYLIAVFDGHGHCRLLRGNGQNADLFNCHRALQNQPLVGGSKPASNCVD